MDAPTEATAETAAEKSDTTNLLTPCILDRIFQAQESINSLLIG